METYKSVDLFLEAHQDQEKLLIPLRQVLLNSGLEETIKWGQPTYVYKNKNVVGLGAFKAYVGIWFFQGALLSDPAKKLINAQEGVTEAMRQWRFNEIKEIQPDLIQAYLQEAMVNVDQGKEIKPTKKPLIIPEQLQNLLDQKPNLKAAFEALNLTKKREFTEHIESAKQEQTKRNRLEKIEPMILAGKGLNDKYR